MLALIDADLIGYRIAFACKDESLSTAKNTLSNYIGDILTCFVDKTFDGCFVDEWKLFLTGKNNYRQDVAVTAVYKGNRPSVKPPHLQDLRSFMVGAWGAVVVDGQEADDAIAIEATENRDRSIIVSLDKDLDQVAGWHFNFVKNVGYYIDEQQGIKNFYKQILTGDAADNIIGLSGIGPVKSEALLKDCTTEKEMYEACIKAYDGNEQRVVENATLLWLRRQPNQKWEPPNELSKTNG